MYRTGSGRLPKSSQRKFAGSGGSFSGSGSGSLSFSPMNWQMLCGLCRSATARNGLPPPGSFFRYSTIFPVVSTS